MNTQGSMTSPFSTQVSGSTNTLLLFAEKANASFLTGPQPSSCTISTKKFSSSKVFYTQCLQHLRNFPESPCLLLSIQSSDFDFFLQSNTDC